MSTRQSMSDLDIDRLNATITLDELTKRIQHQLWAVDMLAKTKTEKLRAEGQKTALNHVLHWIKPPELCPTCGEHHEDCTCPGIGSVATYRTNHR